MFTLEGELSRLSLLGDCGDLTSIVVTVVSVVITIDGSSTMSSREICGGFLDSGDDFFEDVLSCGSLPGVVGEGGPLLLFEGVLGANGS